MKLFELLSSFTPAYLFEMTKSTGKFKTDDTTQAAITQHYRELQQHGKHIGNIGSYPVIEDVSGGHYRVALQYIETVVEPTTQYKINKNRGPIAFCLFKPVRFNNIKYLGIILVHSLSQDFPQLRGRNLLKALLTFMRGYYNKPIIDQSGYQSDEAINALKSLANKTKFNIRWLNIKTGESEPYEPDKDHPEYSPYRSTEQKTNWRITIESVGIHNMGDFSSYNELLRITTRGLRHKLLKELVEQELQNQIYIIYLDMDGVFANFIKRATQLLGRHYDPRSRSPDDEEFFWKKIKAAHKEGEEFWSKMEMLPNAMRLWNYTKKYNPIFLTSIGISGASIDAERQKNRWVKKHFGNYHVIVVGGASKKTKYATKNAVLIDDTPKNITQWEAAGGIGILHKDATSSINALKKLGL